MTEQNHEQEKEKDHFVFYLLLATVVAIGALITVKLIENEKYAPIKEQLNEENKLMNIRLLNQTGE